MIHRSGTLASGNWSTFAARAVDFGSAIAAGGKSWKDRPQWRMLNLLGDPLSSLRKGTGCHSVSKSVSTTHCTTAPYRFVLVDTGQTPQWAVSFWFPFYHCGSRKCSTSVGCLWLHVLSASPAQVGGLLICGMLDFWGCQT